MQKDTLLLLSRLDLDKPGLEKVRATTNNPERAATELLAYYRGRTSVKHPVNRADRAVMKGKAANEQDIRYANDALKHVLFGQPDLPAYPRGDEIDWLTNPVADKEWIWQLHRMYFWHSMGRMYWHTGDEAYAREWCLQFSDWVRKNPHDAEHADAWRSLEAGIRGYSWTGLFQRFLDSPSFTPKVLVLFLNSLYDHATYLQMKYTAKTNWALIEAEGMGFIAMTFPEFRDADSWWKEAVRRLAVETDNQVFADGSSGNCRWATTWYAFSASSVPSSLASLNGRQDDFPADYLKKLERMPEAVMSSGCRTGPWPSFGDSWKGIGEKLFPASSAAMCLDERTCYSWPPAEGRGLRRPRRPLPWNRAGCIPFGAAGRRMRPAWCSSAGPTAACIVNLTGRFELCAGGRCLMPDSGSYIYSGDDPGRAWFRQPGCTRRSRSTT